MQHLDTFTAFSSTSPLRGTGRQEGQLRGMEYLLHLIVIVVVGKVAHEERSSPRLVRSITVRPVQRAPLHSHPASVAPATRADPACRLCFRSGRLAMHIAINLQAFNR